MEAGHLYLRDVVFELLALTQRPTTHDFPYFLLYAIDGYKEYRKDYGSEVSTVELTIEKDGTAALPSDFIQSSKVGFQFGNRVEILLNDNDLANLPNTAYSKDEDYKDLRVPFHSYWYNGRPTEIFGEYRAESRVGYYKILRDCNRIKFDIREGEDLGNKKVYFEYIGKAIKPHTRTIVTTDASKVIQAYAYWKHSQYSLGTGARETLARKQEYLEEIDLMKRRRSDISVAGIKQLYRKYTYYGIK